MNLSSEVNQGMIEEQIANLNRKTPCEDQISNKLSTEKKYKTVIICD